MDIVGFELALGLLCTLLVLLWSLFALVITNFGHPHPSYLPRFTPHHLASPFHSPALPSSLNLLFTYTT
jgi:hypothetical protein